MKNTLLLVLFLCSKLCFANFPENSLGDENPGLSNITEAQFHEIIQRVNDIYQPVFKGVSVNFWFERNWAAKNPNSHVYKYDSQWSKNWKIEILGALARRPEITKEGFTMALCHQIGHLLGGYPMQDYNGLSTEGEADYYAAHVCAKKVFGKVAKKTKLINKLKASVEICDKNFDSKLEIDVCYYTLFGAKSLADFYMIAGQERRAADIENADSYKTKVTLQLHTPSQCRLDTLIAGALCNRSWDDKVIPIDKKNQVCANRPRCWFYGS